MADMNVTPARQGLTPVIWDSEFFTEYVRKNQFARYMGTTMGAMIQVREDLTRKAKRYRGVPDRPPPGRRQTSPATPCSRATRKSSTRGR